MNAKKLAEIAQANKVEIESDNRPTFEDLMYKGSVAKFNSLIAKFTELAKLGFGKVEICLDGTSEMFSVDEGVGRFYSESEVINMLRAEGFKLGKTDDHYDARDYIITWDDSLPITASKIGMDI